ncbi:MAG: 4Fe-4S dicluster domain-containing protein [Candidatus Coatesbacteria bacterium]|nr:4Fe-4S dicluster domain-containing protein [Candidatus Coatesbacteria bacterium]
MLSIEDIQKYGIVGCGGAGFPSHIKLMNEVKTFIINAVECEPLLWTDKYLALNHYEEIINGIDYVIRLKKPEKTILCIKDKFYEYFTELIKRLDNIEVMRMKDYYPAGDELIIINEALGLTISPGKIPKDYGILVNNIETLFHLGNAASKNRKMTRKYLTVTTKTKSYIVSTPIGTRFRDVLAKLDIKLKENEILIENGLMTGNSISEDSFINSTTKALIVYNPTRVYNEIVSFSPSRQQRRNFTACIQCSRCTDLCPRYLIGHPLKPHRIMRCMMNDEKKAIDFGLFLCSDCGLCEIYACPMGIAPRQIIRKLKNELENKGTLHENLLKTNTRKFRLVSSKSLYKRLAVTSKKPDSNEVCINPETVRLQIKSKGSLLVSNDEKVTEGQPLWKPDNTFNVWINATISGKIKIDSEGIIIKD